MARKKMTEKQEKTLNKMKETRKADTLFLRDKIMKKLEWAKEEKKKGIALIEKQFSQIKVNQESINRIDGAIMALTDLLQKEEIKEKEND